MPIPADIKMSLFKDKLSQLEMRLQTLVEGSAARLFPLRSGYHDLPARLVAAMQSGTRSAADGKLLAPDVYSLLVNPAHADLLHANQVLLDDLAYTIMMSGKDMGLVFFRPPVIKIVPDPAMRAGDIRIQAEASPDKSEHTSTMVYEAGEEGATLPANAYLIVNGSQMFLLKTAVVNIGRRIDNHLVIEDTRVSRLHAQLRAVKGRYVIFDLDSAGGTFINGERVKQANLYPGDVISLAGVPLVYSQDISTDQDDTDGSTLHMAL